MHPSIQREYGCTANYMNVCDYKNVAQYLPNGENDRRIDNDWGVVAQVFSDTIQKASKELNQATIAFNRDMVSLKPMQDVIKERNERIAKGEMIWSVGGQSAEAITIHEWGHIYSNHMVSAMIYDEQDAKDYWAWYQTLSKDDIRKGLSDYAAENRGEFEAECFLEMQLPNPRPLAVKWWSFMQKILEKGY